MASSVLLTPDEQSERARWRCVSDVLTMPEAAAWWGVSRQSMHVRLLTYEARTGHTILRRSGNAWLVHVEDVRLIYGEPKNNRPVYLD